jgi:DNA-binding GntR family transcriptional regulator
VSIKTIGQQVYERLHHDVMAGELVPGTWLRELDLAAMLGVSRTPVREAVRRLAQDGLLEISPNRGVQVRALGVAEALDAYEVRELVEGAAARRAAPRNPNRCRCQKSSRLSLTVECAEAGDLAPQWRSHRPRVAAPSHAGVQPLAQPPRAGDARRPPRAARFAEM